MTTKKWYGHKLTWLLAGISCVAALCRHTSADESEVEHKIVHGRILDESGKPVAGAIVRHSSYEEDDDFATSDTEGRFSLPKLRPERWTFLWAISAEGDLLGTGHLLEMQEGDRDVPEVVITLKSNVRTITGKVVDENGQPIAGAVVGGAGQCAEPIRVKSDAEGKFRFPWPSEETLQRVYAFKKGVGFDFAGTDEPDEAQEIIVPEKIDNGPFTLVLQQPQTVKIRVVDEAGEPIQGAHVSPWLIDKNTTQSGRNHTNFNTAQGPWGVTSFTDENGIATFDWIPTANTSQITFTAYGNYRSGNRMKDGVVCYFGSNRVRYEPNAASNNWWEYEECKNGKCFLVKEGETEKWIYETDEAGVVKLTLPKLARIQGTVKYSDGTPAARVMISRKDHDRCGHGIRFSDENGNFDLRENLGTKLNLAVESQKECLPTLFAYDVGDGTEVQQLDFVLQKGVKLTGTILDAEGKPLQGVYTIWINEKNPDPNFPKDSVTRQTGNFGRPQIQSVYEYILPPGTFAVMVQYQDQRSELHTIEVKAEQTGEIRLDLQLKK
ncbi:MAG: hypothetical protein ACRC46_01640 [Thermoguttaceae bacterium]